MLSNLRPEHSSPILQHIHDLENGNGGELWDHFRGAFGRTREEQVMIYDEGMQGMQRNEEGVEERQTACMS